MKKVLFLGLGHLGKFFVQQNASHQIIGTKRKTDPKIDCPQIEFTIDQSWSHAKDFDVVIISFPPMDNYAAKLNKLLTELAPLKKVIFISSTSVFGNGQISETSQKFNLTRNAKELNEAERLIKQLEDYVILRPGGLIDSKRHPKSFTRRLEVIKRSKTNVNLVHTYDVAAFLHHVIDQDIKNEDFNLVCSDHPSKEDFYGRFAEHLKFDPTDSALRIIDNSKSKSTGFSYKYDDLDWV